MSQAATSDRAAGPSATRARLDRSISFADYVAIGLGAILGVGWVVYAGQWVLAGGVLGAILAFALGGLCLLPVGKCYAELTSAIPVTGGEIAFGYLAFGPVAAFAVGWALSLAYLAVIPFETIAIGAMVEAIVPALKSEPLYNLGGYPVALSTVLPGLLAAIGVAVLNLRGNAGSARFQFFALLAMLLCALVFCSVAVWKGDTANLQPLFADHAPGATASLWTLVPASIASVLVIVPFFLMGFDCIPQVAEEAGLQMSPRRLGVAIVATIVLGALFYVLVILALGIAVSGEDLRLIVAQPDVMPMAEVFRSSFESEWMARLVLVAALLGLITTLNGIFIAGTRILFALGRGALLPSWFSAIHPTYHTPVNAIAVAGGLACAGPLIGKAGLAPIVSSFSFIICVVMLMTVSSTLWLRKTRPQLPRPYRIHTGTIWAGIAVTLSLLALMLVPGSPGQLGVVEFTVLGVWALLGVLFYAYQSRRGICRETQANMILADLAKC